MHASAGEREADSEPTSCILEAVSALSAEAAPGADAHSRAACADAAPCAQGRLHRLLTGTVVDQAGLLSMLVTGEVTAQGQFDLRSKSFLRVLHAHFASSP